MPSFFKPKNIELIRRVLIRSFRSSPTKAKAEVPTPFREGQPPQHLANSPIGAWLKRVSREDRLIHDLANEGGSGGLHTPKRIK